MKNQDINNKEGSFVFADTSVIHEGFILKTIMEHSQDTFYFKDKDSRFLFISRILAWRLGINDPEYIIGKTDYDLFEYSHANEAYRDEQEIISTGKPIIGKTEQETWKDGTIKWVSTSKYPFYDKLNNIIGTWGISRDITDLKTAEEELERVNRELRELNQKLEVLSTTDSLSGLCNHRSFYETVKKEFARRTRNVFTDSVMVLLDIDNFKGLNDSMGHLMGDFALRHVANLLKGSIRSEDFAFRYGGDEFIVLLIDTNMDGAKKAAEKLLEVVTSTPFVSEGIEVRLTVSGGAAALSEAKDTNELMNIADKRLYASKKAGRNRITLM